MTKISIKTASPYSVLVGENILSQAGTFLQKVSNQAYQKVAIITDENVSLLYGDAAVESFKAAGFQVFFKSIPVGENSKSKSQAFSLIHWLIENEFTRSDVLVALGGGVIGDLVGFVSSIYLRGCDFVQIPTTFLAATDSSVGGKTAINLPHGKNLVGTFWQPRLVLCDVSTFTTLPKNTYNDGVAEAIKYGCIWDKALFQTLMTQDWQKEHTIDIVAACISIKAEIVSTDEREQGLRKILNFGHTLAHAIEILSNHKITHGQAVAIGMCIVAESQENEGLLPRGTSKQIADTLQEYSLPTKTSYTAAELAKASLSDKKRKGNHIDIIGLKEIGHYDILTIPTSDLQAFIERGF